MSTPKTKASNGTITTPPPNPVSAPRKPATKEPNAMKTVKASMVINQRRERSAPDGRHCSGGGELAEGVITTDRHSRSADRSSLQPRCNKSAPDDRGVSFGAEVYGFQNVLVVRRTAQGRITRSFRSNRNKRSGLTTRGPNMKKLLD